MKRLILLSVVLLTLAGNAFAQEELNMCPDRPGVTTGAGVVSKGSVLWETGFEAERADNEWSVLLPTTLLRVGVSDFAEVRLEYDGTLNQHSPKWQYSVNPLVLGAKFKVFEGGRRTTQIAVMANLALPCTRALAQQMYVAPSVYALFNHDICDWFNLGYNVGGEWNGIDAMPNLFLGLCLGFSITDRFGAFVENYDYLAFPRKEQALLDWNIDAGFNVMVHPRVQLDVYAGFNAADPASRFDVGMGVAWLIN